MGVTVTGGSAADKAMAETAYARVVQVLPWDGEVPIFIGRWPGRPAKSEAQATPNTVRIYIGSVHMGPPGRPEYLLYEEIAHYVLEKMGLPHDGNAGVFLQELFGGYVKFKLARQYDPQLFQDLFLPPIPTGGPERPMFYGVGTDIGAALAGMKEAEPLIEAWLRDIGNETWSAEVQDFYDLLRATDLDPPRLARLCLDRLRSARRAFDE